jgi:hypothetical protein
MEGELSLHILFNGRVGVRQHRFLLFLIDGVLVGYRPYVGYYDYVGEIQYGV